MLSKETIENAISELFGDIEFTLEPANLYDPLRYMIEIGGKRLRPRLCLTAFGLYCDTITPQTLQCAAAIEVFHSFTLIHDDIMDKSGLRRGKPTVWTRWGENGAILSGDAMCIDSYRRVSMAPREVLPDVLELFNSTAAYVCDGQQYDMDFESRESIGMDEYMKMIGLKTGVLIACAAKMGALLAGAPKEDCEKLYRYGYDLGHAFQVADDYLDAYGDEKVFGKPIGGDIINKKKSWLTVRAAEKCGDPARVAALLNSDMERDAKIAAVKAVYEKYDVAADAKAEIARLTGSALDAISSLSAASNAPLIAFADSLVGRTK